MSEAAGDGYINYLIEFDRQENSMTRKQEEPMPEFETGDEAYEWMQRKLNKSWVDDIPGVGLDVEATQGPKAVTSTPVAKTSQVPTHSTSAPNAVDISVADLEAMFNLDIGPFDDPSS